MRWQRASFEASAPLLMGGIPCRPFLHPFTGQLEGLERTRSRAPMLHLGVRHPKGFALSPASIPVPPSRLLVSMSPEGALSLGAT